MDCDYWYQDQDLLEELTEDLICVKDRPHQFPDYHLASALTIRNIPSKDTPHGGPIMTHIKGIISKLGLIPAPDPIKVVFGIINSATFHIGRQPLFPTPTIPDPVLDALQEYISHVSGEQSELGETVTSQIRSLDTAPQEPWHIAVENLSAILQTMVLWRNHQLQFPALKFPRSLITQYGLRPVAIPSYGDGVACTLCTGCIKGAPRLALSLHSCQTERLQLVTTKDSFVLRKGPQEAIFDINLLLMFSDMMVSRSIMARLSYVKDPVIQDHIISTSTLRTLYGSIDAMMERQGNAGYQLVKLLEPMCLTAILRQHLMEDISSADPRFPDSTIKDIKQFDQDHNEHMFENLYKQLEGIPPITLLEIFGIFRHWGHPILRVDEGLHDVVRHTRQLKTINHILVGRLASEMGRILLHHYFFKNNSWPKNTYVPPGISWILQECVDTNRWPTEREMMMIPPFWDKIQHDAIIEDIGTIPLTHLLADKSHSLDLDELKQMEHRMRRNPQTSTTRRVLLTALKTGDIDPIEFLKEVDKEGLKCKDLVIGLKGKEREVKIKGRYFSLMSFHLRLYFVSTEWLITQYILPMFHEITMTYSQVTLFSMMSNLTKGANRQGESTYMIHLDFEKWNNHQRHESTYPVFRVLDKAFGFTNVISRTHKIFESCFYYYSETPNRITTSKDNIPWCWQGQLGGIEGLRQKGWSVIGALLLRLVSSELRINYEILLQGDNQVVILKFHKECTPDMTGYTREKMRLLHKAQDVLRALCDYSQQLGLITKREETWISSRLMMYGKFPILDGASQGIISKRVSRLYAMSNDVSPTLSNMMSTVVTLGLTMAQVSNTITLPMAVCYWYLSKLVHMHMEYSPIHGLGLSSLILHSVKTGPPTGTGIWSPQTRASDQALLFDLLTRDSILGGLGGVSPIRFFVRQFVDPLTESLTSIRNGCNHITNPIFRNTLVNSGYPPYTKRVDYKRLIEDPTSLSLPTGAKVSAVVKGVVEEYLSQEKHTITNSVVREALTLHQKKKDSIVAFLMSWNVILPKVASDIYSASLSGLVESVLGHFTGTRTIIALPWGATSDRLSRRLQTADKRLMEAFIMFWDPVTTREIWGCSYLRAVQMREASWQVSPICGVTVPHPFEQFKIVPSVLGVCPSDELDPPHDDYILCLVDDGLVYRSVNLSSGGPMKPYLGSNTGDKRQTVTACEATSDEPLLKRALRVLNEVNWYSSEGGNIGQSLIALFSSLTDYPMDFATLKAQRLYWDPDHHYISERVSHGSFAPMCYTPYTHISCNSNLLRSLGRGMTNYKIVFQSLYIAFSTHILMKQACWGDITRAYHIHPACKSCLTPTEEIQTESGKVFKDWPTIPPCMRSNSSFYCLSKTTTIYTTPLALLPRAPEGLCDQSKLLSAHLHIAVYIVSVSNKTRPLMTYKDKLIDVANFLTLDICHLTEMVALVVCLAEGLEMVKSHKWPTDIPAWDRVRRRAIERWSISVIPEDVGRCMNTRGVLDQMGQLDTFWGTSLPIRSHEVSKALHHLVMHTLLDRHSRLNRPIQCIKSASILFPSDMTQYNYVSMILWGCRLIPDSVAGIVDPQPVFDWIRNVPSRVPWGAWSTMKLSIEGIGVDAYMLPMTWREFSHTLPPCHIGSQMVMFDHRTLAPNPQLAYEIDGSPDVTDKPWFQNPANAIMRDLGTSTSAYWKLASIMPKLPKPKDMIVCGDGTGGFTRYLLSYCRHSRIVFNSLLDTGFISEQSLGSQLPPALLGIPQTEQARVINAGTVGQTPTDLRKHDTITYLQCVCNQNQLDINLIISDAEMYNTDDAITVIQKLLMLGKSFCRPVTLLLKVHMTLKFRDAFRWCISNSLTNCGVVYWRSPYSRFGGNEVYVEFSLLSKNTVISPCPDPRDVRFLGIMEDQYLICRRYLQQKRHITKQAIRSFCLSYNRVCQELEWHHPPMYDLSNSSSVINCALSVYRWAIREFLWDDNRRIHGHLVATVEAKSRRIKSIIIATLMGFHIFLSVIYQQSSVYTHLVELLNKSTLRLKVIKDTHFVDVVPGLDDDIPPVSFRREINLVFRFLSVMARISGLRAGQKVKQYLSRPQYRGFFGVNGTINETLWGVLELSLNR
ncbi:TPA_asm: hypothetical protein [Metorhabdovirus 2]|nr:TPA_asm: hypothetical protein [Metorhabdovirus 2]